MTHTNTTNTKRDIYAEITDRIIAELEKGIIPWKKPWAARVAGKVSHSTGRQYSLLNQFWLSIQEKEDTITPAEYATWNQITNAGGHVKKGAKGKSVLFFKRIIIDAKDENGQIVRDEDGNPEKKVIPVLKSFTVFNIEKDTEGVNPKHLGTIDTTNPVDPIADAETLLREYTDREGIALHNVESDQAYYSPMGDCIHLPLLSQFKCAEEYYSTAFHEATHSTGHKSRLDRFSEEGPHSFGSENYSKEELVAEIGAASILARLGIESPKTFTNSAAYIQSWLRVLKNDKHMIVSAACKAEKAVALIFGESEEEPEPEEA